jgi:hypothetical protein
MGMMDLGMAAAAVVTKIRIKKRLYRYPCFLLPILSDHCIAYQIKGQFLVLGYML